jgi:quercetin 2,3-dioxygenase
MAKNRIVQKLFQGVPTSDGDGVKLTRIIGSKELNFLDPFLLLDEFKNDDPRNYAGGFPPHPHRGFETITYMIAGSFRHRDSQGNEGHLGPGSVQWMTAGKGILHSEMPEQKDGLAWGLQLWLNLPAQLKSIDPKYQDIPSEKIPSVKTDSACVRVISGSYQGTRGPGQSFFPVNYFDVHLNQVNHGQFYFSLPVQENCFIYVYEGSLQCGTETIPFQHCAVLVEGDEVRLKANEEKSKFIFLSAPPIGEPIAKRKYSRPLTITLKENLVSCNRTILLIWVA